MKPNGYPKQEKLKKRKDIALLFEKGKWVSYKELSILFLQKENLKLQKVGVAVSKKYFPKATDRNKIKRLLREAYRLNKNLFINTFGKNTMSMIFYKSYKKQKKLSEINNLFLQLCNSL